MIENHYLKPSHDLFIDVGGLSALFPTLEVFEIPKADSNYNYYRIVGKDSKDLKFIPFMYNKDHIAFFKDNIVFKVHNSISFHLIYSYIEELEVEQLFTVKQNYSEYAVNRSFTYFKRTTLGELLKRFKELNPEYEPEIKSIYSDSSIAHKELMLTTIEEPGIYHYNFNGICFVNNIPSDSYLNPAMGSQRIYNFAISDKGRFCTTTDYNLFEKTNKYGRFKIGKDLSYFAVPTGKINDIFSLLKLSEDEIKEIKNSRVKLDSNYFIYYRGHLLDKISIKHILEIDYKLDGCFTEGTFKNTGIRISEDILVSKSSNYGWIYSQLKDFYKDKDVEDTPMYIRHLFS